MTASSYPRIRNASPADAAALADFAARVFIATFGPDNTQEDMDAYIAQTYSIQLQRREIEDRGIVTLLAEDGASLAGFAQVKIEAEAIEIARFYVDRPWHGRGLAQQLMNACLGTARALHKKRVWLAVWERNPRAIAFYSKCGFRDTGSQPFLLGSDVQTDRVMERPIT